MSIISVTNFAMARPLHPVLAKRILDLPNQNFDREYAFSSFSRVAFAKNETIPSALVALGYENLRPFHHISESSTGGGRMSSASATRACEFSLNLLG